MKKNLPQAGPGRGTGFCDPGDDDRFFKSKPRIIVEVVSESTRGTDEREKLLTFIQLPSLEEHVLVEQDRMKVTIHRRDADWVPEFLEGPEALLKLHSIGFEMPLIAHTSWDRSG